MDQNQKPETLLDDVSQANNTTTTTPPVTSGVPVSPAPVSAPQTEPESLDLTPAPQTQAPVPEPVASEPVSVDVAASVDDNTPDNPELENTVITSAPITPEAIEEVVESTPSVAPVSNPVPASQPVAQPTVQSVEQPTVQQVEQPVVAPVNPEPVSNLQPAQVTEPVASATTESPASNPDVVGTIANPNEVMAATAGVSTEGAGTPPPIDINGGNFDNPNGKLEPPKKGGIGKIIGLILIVAILGAVIIFLPDIQSFIVRQMNPIESEPTPTPTATPTVTSSVLTCTLTTDDETTGLHRVLTETYSGQNDELANIEVEEVVTPIENTTMDFATALETATSSCLLEMEQYPATSGVVATCDTTVANSLTRSLLYDLAQIQNYNASLAGTTTPSATPDATATPEETVTPTATPETVIQSPINIEYSLGESIANIATVKQSNGYTCTTE
ncbi:MAG: hypothetical protein DBY23_04450 [Bacillota bacterium]|nr:MAG: hypothetical protein DBY23_04450 [Bacillota bacterium]